MNRHTPEVKRLRQRVAELKARVTELALTLKTLRESEMNYRSLFDQSSDAIVVFDPKTLTMLQFNDEACRRLGYSRKDFAKLKLSDYEAIESAEDLKRRARRIPQNSVEVFETKQRTKRGALLDIEIRTKAVWFGGRRLIQGVWRDITQSKRAERALRESEERYRLMVEAVPMLAWRCDAAGLIIDVNKRWLEYTGQSQDAVRGTGWTAALHPDDRAHALRQVNTGLASGSVQAEGRVRRAADGQYRWHLARALPVNDAHGRTVAWFGCAADIEDEKRAEEALRLTNEQLEQKVKDRTARLRGLAAELTTVEHRERRRIAHLLHEDLQQRLAAIPYRTHELKEADRDGSVPRTADWILKTLGGVMDLSHDLTSRLSPPVLYELGLRKALDWLATDMQSQFGLAVKVTGLRSCRLPSDEVRAFAFDAVRELLMNVHKHAGVKTAEVRMQARGKRHVTIAVIDKGKGCTETDKRSNKFGLFSIRERAEAMGLEFTITSQPGKGTHARLALPIV